MNSFASVDVTILAEKVEGFEVGEKGFFICDPQCGNCASKTTKKTVEDFVVKEAD